MPSGGKRPRAGRTASEVKRKLKTFRLKPEVIEIIEAQDSGALFIEDLVMASQSRYDDALKNTKVTGGPDDYRLVKDGNVILSVGDKFKDSRNPHLGEYVCTNMDLHFITFENNGKPEPRQTVHFIENELHLIPA